MFILPFLCVLEGGARCLCSKRPRAQTFHSLATRRPAPLLPQWEPFLCSLCCFPSVVAGCWGEGCVTRIQPLHPPGTSGLAGSGVAQGMPRLPTRVLPAKAGWAAGPTCFPLLRV